MDIYFLPIKNTFIFLMWQHLAIKEAGKCGLYSEQRCAQLKIKNSIMRGEWILGDRLKFSVIDV